MKPELKEASLYEKLDKGRLRCNLCAHRCVIAEGKLGVCKVRRNEGGVLYSLVYGRAISQHVDPIEKKPLYHFYPGSSAYSVATPGCNFRCQWCQNWEIAHMPRERGIIAGQRVTPQQIVNEALATSSRSIAYTYTEPTIFFEYAYDIARLANAAGIANIYVTNGYMTPEMLEAFHPYLDAANVDLKAFREKTYHRYVGAALQPILDNLKLMKRLGIWVEVTTLLIPDLNDDPAELREAANFIAQELGPDTPWHISRFFPNYRMTDRPPTPVATMQRAQQIGLEAGLHYVYLGNLHGEMDTTCPNCGRLLVQRYGYWDIRNYIQDNHCPDCGALIAGVW
ncbi:MAG: AmmeMemoRadiSam system radical SAM enzyme [Anaerolineales bacterium]|nr:AmmeMemoRadiSam system radical SAM enzyme [Anaerolineales bacterium]